MNTTLFDVITPILNASKDICTNEIAPREYFIFYVTIIWILVLCNGVLLVGIVISWRVLRQNIVYRYLISCVLSEICFCLVSAYEIYNTEYRGDEIWITGGIFQRYDKDNFAHQGLMQYYSYRKGLLIALLITKEFNIGALIYAVSDNVQFVGRHSELNLTSNKEQKLNYFKPMQFLNGKKCRNASLILLTWLIPIGLSLPVAFDWNCLQYCPRLPAYNPASICVAPKDSGTVCSRQWLPMTRSYVIAMTALYTGALAIMFSMLVSTVRKFYKAYKPIKSIVKFTASRRKRIGEVNAMGRRTSKGGLKPTALEVASPSCSQSYQVTSHIAVESVRLPPTNILRASSVDLSNTEMPCDTNKSSYSPVATITISSRRRPPLHSSIKLLIVLTTSLLLSGSPLMFVLFIDVIAPESDVISGKVLLATLAITFIQAASLPFVLLKYMPGLRKACINILLKCPCLHTTVIRPKTNPTPKKSSMEKAKNEKTPRTAIVPCEVPNIPVRNLASKKYHETKIAQPDKNSLDIETNVDVDQPALGSNSITQKETAI